VLPSARKLKELGAASGDELPEIEPVDEAPRALTAAEGNLGENHSSKPAGDSGGSRMSEEANLSS
jgi:hypothetical protein